MKQRKPLDSKVLIALVVVGALIVGGLGYLVLVRPQGAKLSHIKADEQDAQAKLDAYHQKVLAARAAPKIQIADVYRLAKAMPAETDMPDVVLELSQLARDTGIRFDSIAPQPAVAVGSYAVLPISVTFNGTFYDLADLLYRLRSLVNVHGGRLDATGRLFTVDSLSFGEGPTKFPNIQATLVIDAFVYGTGVPAASVPVTPTTTTTGETTTSSTTTTTAAASGASATGAP